MNEGMETLRQFATTSLFLQSEKTNSSNHVPTVKINTGTDMNHLPAVDLNQYI